MEISIKVRVLTNLSQNDNFFYIFRNRVYYHLNFSWNYIFRVNNSGFRDLKINFNF